MTGFLCALPLLAGLLSCPPDDVLAVGYVEGEYVQLAPVSSAELVEVAVRQGDRVTTGQPVARQERTDAEIALAEAEAARAEAEAELANLREGSRPEEIAVTEAALEAAQVRLGEAQRQAERQTALARRNVVSQANLDTAIAERDTAQTEVKQLLAQLAVERLPGAPAARRRRREPARRCRGRGQRRPLAPRQAHAHRAGRRRGHRRLPPRRRDRRTDRPRGLHPPRRRLQARGLRRRDRRRRPRARHRARGALRRLPGRADRDGLLRLRRARVHPAGDLLGREPPEARLPRRGAAGAGRPGAAPRPDRRRRPWRSDRDARHRHRRPPPDQALRRPRRRRRRVDDRQPRRDRRLPRPERLGQDHDDPHDVRPAHPRRGRGRGARPRPPHREPRHQGPGRLHDPEVLALRGPDHRGEPRPRRRPLPPARPARRGPRHPRHPRPHLAPRSSSPASSPAAGSSASRSPPASCTRPSSSSSTSRPPASTPRPAASSGTRSTSSPPPASPCSSPPTTWTRPSAATASATSPTAA